MTDEIPQDKTLQSLPDDADVYEATLAFDRALTAAPGDRTLLRRWAARFPEFEADFITVGYSRFALGQTLTDPVEDYTWEETLPAPVRPALLSLASEAEARGLDAPALARRLRLDRTLLLRLEQRTVAAASVPRVLVNQIALALDRSISEIIAYLRAAPRLAGATHYRARKAPSLIAESRPDQPTFADEVRRSAKLTAEDKDYWLGEAERETLGEDLGDDLGEDAG